MNEALEVKFCCKCAAEEPEVNPRGQLRGCGECGSNLVMTVDEMMSFIADADLKGNVSNLSDFIDTEYEEAPLDFEDDEEMMRMARLDALKDFNEEFGDEY